MAEGDIPDDLGDFLPGCLYPPEKHVEVARAAKLAFPDIFEWMKSNPDGVSEDMPDGREKFTRLETFIENLLPGAHRMDVRAVSQLLFMAAAYTPEMIRNEINHIRISSVVRKRG